MPYKLIYGINLLIWIYIPACTIYMYHFYFSSFDKNSDNLFNFFKFYCFLVPSKNFKQQFLYVNSKTYTYTFLLILFHIKIFVNVFFVCAVLYFQTEFCLKITKIDVHFENSIIHEITYYLGTVVICVKERIWKVWYILREAQNTYLYFYNFENQLINLECYKTI